MDRNEGGSKISVIISSLLLCVRLLSRRMCKICRCRLFTHNCTNASRPRNLFLAPTITAIDFDFPLRLLYLFCPLSAWQQQASQTSDSLTGLYYLFIDLARSPTEQQSPHIIVMSRVNYIALVASSALFQTRRITTEGSQLRTRCR